MGKIETNLHLNKTPFDLYLGSKATGTVSLRYTLGLDGTLLRDGNKMCGGCRSCDVAPNLRRPLALFPVDVTIPVDLLKFGLVRTIRLRYPSLLLADAQSETLPFCTRFPAPKVINADFWGITKSQAHIASL